MTDVSYRVFTFQVSFQDKTGGRKYIWIVPTMGIREFTSSLRGSLKLLKSLEIKTSNPTETKNHKFSIKNKRMEFIKTKVPGSREIDRFSSWVGRDCMYLITAVIDRRVNNFTIFTLH